jgi:hypothetical protein
LWLRSFFDQVGRDRGAGAAIRVGHPEAEWRGRAVEWNDLVERARRVSSDVFTALDALRNDHNFVVDRIQLVLVRILEPLLESYASGGIERYHGSLSDEELADFVRGGFQREIILLNRENDLARAQRTIEGKTLSRSAGDRNAILDSLQNLIPDDVKRLRKPEGVLSHAMRRLI